MVFFVVLGGILALGLLGKRPGRSTYVVIAVAALFGSAYEYFK